ncbi:hypothetical protein ARAM_001550 [Aspergillus rambellii]|uniref:PXA domain-containing protein n=1 Tax=Aspergillus rambellii TaxID=308745 RepID=A0A0F8WRH8_9EURO|nr:hypothetical protein ARAM_001550 [Aspergillus rambellii]
MDELNDTSIGSQPDKRQQDKPAPSTIATMSLDKDDNKVADHTPSAVQTKKLMDITLEFLSTCSNEKLILVIICLMGAVYLLLGRLGLLLIGVILGVFLHASWEGHNNDNSSESQRSSRKQLSLNVAHRLLNWHINESNISETKENNTGGGIIGSELSVELDTSTFGPATTAALTSLIDAALKDYVNYWYEPILPSESTFPLSCQATLTSFITSISSHLSRKRTADTFLEFLTNSSSMVIVFLNELSAAFEVAGPPVSSESAILRYLESRPESSLANILENQQQRKKLIMISDDILSRFLDPKVYNCIPLRNFLREILAGVVFESTITSLSRPEFMNSWIIYLFSEGESEIMSAIDAGVEGAQSHGITATNPDVNPPTSASTGNNIAESTLPSKISRQESSKSDKATEAAMVEAKRLSDMIAAQDLQRYSEQQSNATPKIYDEDRTTSTPSSGITADGKEALPDHNAARQTSSSEEAADSHAANPNESINSHRPNESISSSSIQPPISPSTNHPSSENASTLPSFTLHRASITVDDGSDLGDKAPLRSKPTSSYLLQVEPSSGRSSGWMVFKKYTDFESIHDTLGTISRLNEIRSFLDTHPVMPPWKGQTRQALAQNLERYLQDALQHEPLAESVTMRRFLEKDGRLGPDPSDSSTKPGFFFPSQAAFENVGKGVLGVFANAPKGVSGGGKAVIEGVTGVFSGGLNKKTTPSPGITQKNNKDGFALSQKNDLPLKAESPKGNRSSLEQNRDTGDTVLSSQPMELNGTPGLETPSCITPLTNPSDTSIRATLGNEQANVEKDGHRTSTDSISLHESNGISSSESLSSKGENQDSLPEPKKEAETAGRPAPKNQNNPITTDETQMAVELIFAVINELYCLSSAWNIRRTLLNAAKSYILRPGNPSLETIRNLLQESMIDSNTSDEAIGLYLVKLRENALPTEEELRSWPADTTDTEKERLRETARRVLVQKGLPQAITGVMGAAASREALGKVFDSLQVDVIARGFVFSILLQALKAIVL